MFRLLSIFNFHFQQKYFFSHPLSSLCFPFFPNHKTTSSSKNNSFLLQRPFVLTFPQVQNPSCTRHFSSKARAHRTLLKLFNDEDSSQKSSPNLDITDSIDNEEEREERGEEREEMTEIELGDKDFQEREKKEYNHIPVLKDQVVKYLCTDRNKVIIDATMGAGGHTQAILESNDAVQVYGCDRDGTVFERNGYRELLQKHHGRFFGINARWTDLPLILKAKHQIEKVDGILFDLGVSSMQLDEADRGFSFRSTHNALLDMRMDPTWQLTAYTIVNQLPEDGIRRILYNFGEEEYSHRIAQAIVRERRKHKIETTRQLATLVAETVPGRVRYRHDHHPATKTFQAIRIAVNDELNQLKQGLQVAESLLNPGGRLLVISYHSLEDRFVKQFLRVLSKEGIVLEEKIVEPALLMEPSFKLVQKKVIIPTRQEILQNPRSRSAKLRVAERTSTPPQFSTVADALEFAVPLPIKPKI